MKDELTIKIETSIKAIKEHEPLEGYFFADSFGKDSGVVKHLLDIAGVKYDAHHNFTTVDPPQLIRHGLKNHPDTTIDRPKISMWKLIEKKGFPPTRMIRYCCSILKERGGRGRVVVTGVRKDESTARSKTELIAPQKNNPRIIRFNPILDWTSQDVWEFTYREKIPYCELYDQGFTRLGCVGCPLSGTKQMEFEFQFFPKHYVAYLRAFDRAMKNKPTIAEHYGFQSPLDMMHWWIYGSHLPNDKTTQSLLSEAT